MRGGNVDGDRVIANDGPGIGNDISKSAPGRTIAKRYGSGTAFRDRSYQGALVSADPRECDAECRTARIGARDWGRTDRDRLRGHSRKRAVRIGPGDLFSARVPCVAIATTSFGQPRGKTSDHTDECDSQLDDLRRPARSRM